MSIAGFFVKLCQTEITVEADLLRYSKTIRNFFIVFSSFICVM